MLGYLILTTEKRTPIHNYNVLLQYQNAKSVIDELDIKLVLNLYTKEDYI
jgi:hypothetical protein